MCLGMLCYLFWFSFSFAEYSTILIFVTYNAYLMQIQTSCLHPHVVLFLFSVLFVCLLVFYIQSTAKSFRDGTPIYCPLRRTSTSVFTPFLPVIKPWTVAAVHYTTTAPRKLHIYFFRNCFEKYNWAIKCCEAVRFIFMNWYLFEKKEITIKSIMFCLQIYLEYFLLGLLARSDDLLYMQDIHPKA